MELLALIVLCVIAVTTTAVCLWFLNGMLVIVRGDAPFVLSHRTRVATMIRLAEIQPTDHVVDLGCGDGRILIGALEAGAKKAIGYDLHRGGLWLARWRAWRCGVSDRLGLHRQSFWEADLSRFDVIFVYQLPKTMPRILAKIRTEARPGTRVISHAFLFEGWVPERAEEAVYRYRV